MTYPINFKIEESPNKGWTKYVFNHKECGWKLIIIENPDSVESHIATLHSNKNLIYSPWQSWGLKVFPFRIDVQFAAAIIDEVYNIFTAAYDAGQKDAKNTIKRYLDIKD